jgi:hypothetical protein
VSLSLALLRYLRQCKNGLIKARPQKDVHFPEWIQQNFHCRNLKKGAVKVHLLRLF